MNFNENIKAAREDADLTQEAAATKIGCTRKQISRYEKGEQDMTASKLRALCLLYNVSADYLLNLPRHMPWPR